MALDRESIEKKDFAVGRRGYDPDSVDEHLSAVATEVEELKASTTSRSESLAASASEQVRSIVDAAEASASKIKVEAEQEAKQIRSEARAEASLAREQAAAQAGEYIAKISHSAASMLERIDAMEQELGTAVESLRTGATRLTADLRLLEAELRDVKDAVSAQPEAEKAADDDLTPTRPTGDAGEGADAEAEVVPAVAAVEEKDEVELEDETARAAGAPEPTPAAKTAVEEEEGDLEGARLIALNMALNGNPREEIERYLAENFELADRDALLDEVYASVEG